MEQKRGPWFSCDWWRALRLRPLEIKKDNQKCRRMSSSASSSDCPKNQIWQASLSANIHVKVKFSAVRTGDNDINASEMPPRRTQVKTVHSCVTVVTHVANVVPRWHPPLTRRCLPASWSVLRKWQLQRWRGRVQHIVTLVGYSSNAKRHLAHLLRRMEAFWLKLISTDVI